MMETNNRTLILAGILIAVLGFGMGYPMFLQPVGDAQRDLDSTKNELEDAEEEDFQLKLAQNRIADAMAVSLPPSLNDAQRLYLEWMTDLTHECNFARSIVKPGGQQQRGGKFLLVSVVVEAEASLEDLSRFLFQFKQADLTHRITKLEITSNGTSRKPRMEFNLTAEGMSVIGSEQKAELSPRGLLAGAVDAQSTQLTVDSADSFPFKTPFITKVGLETMRVTGVDETTWTVERAVDGSDAQEHAVAAMVRHYPVVWDRRDRRFVDYSAFLELPPFSKPVVPREYHPELAGLEDVTIAPGETASITARVDDYDIDLGEIEFSLEDAAEGVTIDTETGQVQWETANDQEPADYNVTVLAFQPGNSELSLRQTVTITVKLPNETPELTIADRVDVLLGQELKLTATATDDGDVADLSFALEGEELPEGLAIDGATGVLTWNPPLTFEPGSHTVEVKVTDKGDPPESATKSITLEVKDDDARFTRLTAIVRKDGRPEVWFENTRTNSQDILHIGDELTVANIIAKIAVIDARFVTLRDQEGIWQLALGNLVRDRVLSSSPTAAESEETVE